MCLGIHQVECLWSDGPFHRLKQPLQCLLFVSHVAALQTPYTPKAPQYVLAYAISSVLAAAYSLAAQLPLCSGMAVALTVSFILLWRSFHCEPLEP